MRLTNLGKIFLALFIFFYWGALRTDSGLLFLLLGILIGSFLMEAKAVFLAARRCKVRIEKKLLFEEGKVSLPLEIISPSLLPSVKILTPWGNSSKIFSVKKKTIFLNESFRRGTYSLNNFIIEHFGSLGLISFRKKLKVAGKLNVAPKFIPVDSPSAGGLKSSVGGKGTGSSPFRTGDNFRSLRPYSPEDSLNRIHWPATAKRGELMVKEFDEERAGYVALWLDVYPCTSPDSRDLLDAACRMAASLALSALEEKHHVKFIVCGEDEVLDINHFPEMDEILKKLASVKFKNHSPFSGKVRRILNKLPFSFSHNFIMLNPREEVINFASELVLKKRKVAVYLPPAEIEKLTEKDGVLFIPFDKMSLKKYSYLIGT